MPARISSRLADTVFTLQPGCLGSDRRKQARIDVLRARRRPAALQACVVARRPQMRRGWARTLSVWVSPVSVYYMRATV